LDAALAFYCGSWLLAQILGHAIFPYVRLTYAEDGGELGRLGVLSAGAVLFLVVGGGTVAWATQPPTVRLEAGLHEGPLVLDYSQKLVGDPGAVVRGGILVTADDVVVRDVTVIAKENGIEVDGAENVLLERVRISGASLDAINVRRGSVTIRDCLIHSPAHKYAQGIDISFSIDLAPSLVEGCEIVGGYEGIVTHSAHVEIRENRVRDTTLRGIAITEMSMGTAEENDVRNGLGVGIYCGDYSHCLIERNSVSGTRPDLASSNGTRMGYGILATFGAEATLRENELTANHRRTRAFAYARILRVD
jgi:nitrous oxidase accessory protein NosD